MGGRRKFRGGEGFVVGSRGILGRGRSSPTRSLLMLGRGRSSPIGSLLMLGYLLSLVVAYVYVTAVLKLQGAI